jgi:hypothetical protein
MRQRTVQLRKYGSFILSGWTSGCSAPPILMAALLGISIIGLSVYLSSASAASGPQIQMRISAEKKRVTPNDPILVSVVVENSSIDPVIYHWWACPEDGNFQSQSKCFTVDPGNMDCLSNYPHKADVKKGQPLKRELLVHIDKRCAGNIVPLKIEFLADGAGFSEKTHVLAESNEIQFEITR